MIKLKNRFIELYNEKGIKESFYFSLCIVGIIYLYIGIFQMIADPDLCTNFVLGLLFLLIFSLIKNGRAYTEKIMKHIIYILYCVFIFSCLYIGSLLRQI